MFLGMDFKQILGYKNIRKGSDYFTLLSFSSSYPWTWIWNVLYPALSLPGARGIRTDRETPAEERPLVWPGTEANDIQRGDWGRWAGLIWRREGSGMGKTHFRLSQSWEQLREEVADCFFPEVPSERSEGSNNKFHQGMTCWAKGRNFLENVHYMLDLCMGVRGIELNFRTHWEIQQG